MSTSVDPRRFSASLILTQFSHLRDHRGHHARGRLVQPCIRPPRADDDLGQVQHAAIHVVGNADDSGFPAPDRGFVRPKAVGDGLQGSGHPDTFQSPDEDSFAPKSSVCCSSALALSCFSPLCPLGPGADRFSTLTRIRCAQPLMIPHRAGVRAPKGVPTENEHEGRTAVLARGVGDTGAAPKRSAGASVAAAWREQLGDGEAGVGRLPRGRAAQVGHVDWGVGSEGVSRGWAAVAMVH